MMGQTQAPPANGFSSRPRPASTVSVSVCICTYKRPHLLSRLLQALARQETAGKFVYSVIVADNDHEQSARAVVEQGVAGAKLIYCVEPTQNIAMVRNKAVAQATGDFVAFIDDDELPGPDWLLTLFSACERLGVSGVLGPVEPLFEVPPPDWLLRGGFYRRPRHSTGFLMGWEECRTGNVMLRASLFEPGSLPFRPEFGLDGEDQDFFRRQIALGHRFAWCDEAVVHEVVPPGRWSRGFLLRRALLRGRNCLKHPSGRALNLGKSILAIPAYGLALPFLFVAGQHLFMRYLVRLTDHCGRVLALVGLNPVSRREM